MTKPTTDGHIFTYEFQGETRNGIPFRWWTAHRHTPWGSTQTLRDLDGAAQRFPTNDLAHEAARENRGWWS